MARKTKMERAIRYALADLDFMERDEKDGSATPSTRRIRIEDIRRVLTSGLPKRRPTPSTTSDGEKDG